MRAVQLGAYGSDPAMAQVPKPGIQGPLDVIVRIGGAGVCRTDLHVIEGQWREKSGVALPYTIGHENAGWIEAVGAAVTHVEVGDPVILHPLATCGLCRACRAGDDVHCENSRFPGIDCDGGYAEYLKTSARSVVKLDASLQPAEVAALADAGLTAYHAVAKAARLLRPGDTAVVLGAGGLGHIGIQVLAALSPVEMIVVDRSPDALALAKELGATHTVLADGNQRSAVLELTGGRGSEILIDFVGEGGAVEDGVAMLKRAGSYFVIGYGGEIKIPTIDVISTEINFVGNLVGSYNDLVELMVLAARGKVKLHTKTYALADAIKVTLGPKGRNAVIEKLTGPPTITNDGATIAREIQLSNPFANMGAQLVKEVAMKTNGAAGDGTTTATVLAQALVREGLRAVDAGANPMQLRRGIEVSIAAVIAALNNRASEIGGQSDLMHVATLSASDDTQIGKVVSDALGRVGTSGVVTVEESSVYGLSLTMVDGVEFDHGYISPYMVTDRDRMEAAFENPLILLSNKKINQVQDLMPTLELVMRSGSGRPLVILAENVEGPALSMLVSNNVHETFKSVVVRAPGFGHRRVAELEDLAALLGGQVVSDDSGLTLHNLTLADLGSCAKIVITENGTTMVGGHGEADEVAARLTQLERELERTQNEHDRDSLLLRIARLSDRVAVINIGAATGVELKEKQHRVEDALSATRAALEEGVIAGGGTSLIQARDALDAVELTGDAVQGREIVRRSLSEPLSWIAINAGYDGPEVIKIVSELPLGQGFNAMTGEYGDMFDFGVIDPVKVTRTALESAASIAALLITTETAIVEEVIGNAGAIMAPGFGDLAEGMVRPSNIY